MVQFQPSETGCSDELLSELVDEILTRTSRGERPAPEEYANRYPQLVEWLRQGIPTLQLLNGLSASPAAIDSNNSGGAEPDDQKGHLGSQTQLGDFRILRLLGRGGMGVV